MTLEKIKKEFLGRFAVHCSDIRGEWYGWLDIDTPLTVWQWIETKIDEACKKARLEEHKQTVLYWKTLPRNELYGIDYHFNRIRELSPKESE